MTHAWRTVCSLGFWAFLAVSSLLLFPVAVVVWAVTVPFDRRLGYAIWHLALA